MRKREIFLLSALMLLLGLVIGFLTAPIKQGICIGNNSGNNNMGKIESCCEDDELDDDEDDMPF